MSMWECFKFICRYSRHDKRSKLPGWILKHLGNAHLNLSTDMAVHIAREVSHKHFLLVLSLVPIIVRTKANTEFFYNFILVIS